MSKFQESFKRISDEFFISRFASLMNGIEYKDPQPTDEDISIVQEAINIASQTFVHILRVKQAGYPSSIAFNTSNEAEKFAHDHNLRGCHLDSIQFVNYDYYNDKRNLL